MNRMFWIPGLFAWGLLSACAQQLEQVNRDLVNLNAALASGLPGRNPGLTSSGLANIAATQSFQTQLTVPPNKDVEVALNAALPTIKKVISIHQCMKSHDDYRLLSAHSVIGEERRIFPTMEGGYFAPLQVSNFHDRNKCVSVRAIDQISLQALNVLKLRVVYLAEDSGETSNFAMQFVKGDDASWKLRRISNQYMTSF